MFIHIEYEYLKRKRLRYFFAFRSQKRNDSFPFFIYLQQFF